MIQVSCVCFGILLEAWGQGFEVERISGGRDIFDEEDDEWEKNAQSGSSRKDTYYRPATTPSSNASEANYGTLVHETAILRVPGPKKGRTHVHSGGGGDAKDKDMGRLETGDEILAKHREIHMAMEEDATDTTDA